MFIIKQILKGIKSYKNLIYIISDDSFRFSIFKNASLYLCRLISDYEFALIELSAECIKQCPNNLTIF